MELVIHLGIVTMVSLGIIIITYPSLNPNPNLDTEMKTWIKRGKDVERTSNRAMRGRRGPSTGKTLRGSSTRSWAATSRC